MLSESGSKRLLKVGDSALRACHDSDYGSAKLEVRSMCVRERIITLTIKHEHGKVNETDLPRRVSVGSRLRLCVEMIMQVPGHVWAGRSSGFQWFRLVVAESEDSTTTNKTVRRERM